MQDNSSNLQERRSGTSTSTLSVLPEPVEAIIKTAVQELTVSIGTMHKAGLHHGDTNIDEMNSNITIGRHAVPWDSKMTQLGLGRLHSGCSAGDDMAQYTADLVGTQPPPLSPDH